MDTKPIIWSFSALKDFENCARRYHEVRIKRSVPRDETDATRYGEALHKAVEDAVRTQQRVAPQFGFMQDVVDALMRKTGVKYPEHEMAVTESLVPCDMKAPNVWCRGIADLLIVDEPNYTAWVVDYKTGNNRFADTDQLELMALLTFAHFPSIKRVRGALLFVLKNDMVPRDYNVDDANAAWWRYRERTARIQHALATDVWHPRKTGLCKTCPVRHCEHNHNGG